jgi:hypothetical protein
MKVIIVDLDGTICDDRHRKHFAESKQYDRYHQGSLVDEIKNKFLIMPFLKVHNYVIATGRNDKFRTQTFDWLRAKGLPAPLQLMMRPEGNKESNVELKRQWLASLREKHDPILAFEDNPLAVDMYRENGVPCIDVTTIRGDFND